VIGAFRCLPSLVRISALDLNNVRAALKHRPIKLTLSLADNGVFVKEELKCPYGEDVKMVQEIAHRQTRLSSAEKDEVVGKYESGMTMMAIAEIYGCHYTTIGSILRKRNTPLRQVGRPKNGFAESVKTEDYQVAVL